MTQELNTWHKGGGLSECFPDAEHDEAKHVLQLLKIEKAMYLTGPTPVIWNGRTYPFISRIAFKTPWWMALRPQKYIDQLLSSYNSLPLRQRNVHAILLSAHPNGRLREQNLKHMLEQPNLLTTPYILDLACQQVTQIGLHIANYFANHPIPSTFFEFARNNPAFLHHMKARATSYWNLHRRKLYTQATDPVLQFLARIENDLGEKNYGR